jgi:hypothetical protein
MPTDSSGRTARSAWTWARAWRPAPNTTSPRVAGPWIVGVHGDELDADSLWSERRHHQKLALRDLDPDPLGRVGAWLGERHPQFVDGIAIREKPLELGGRDVRKRGRFRHAV